MYYLSNYQALDARLSGRRKNDRFFMNLAEIMNLGVAVTDCERKILFLNDNFKEFTAHSDNNRIGRDLADSFDALNGEILRTVYHDCFINDRASIELCWPHHSGRPMAVRITLNAFETEGSKSKLVFAVLSDITEFKDAQKAIIRSENRYKAVVENSLTGLLIEQDDKIVFANQHLADMLAYKMNQLIGLPIWQILPSGDTVFGEEIQTARNGGSGIWLKLKSQRIVYNGKPAVLYNVMEISREKMMENRLLELERELSDLSNTLHTVQEKQRKKIAQDLHNEIGKSLAASKLFVEQLIATQSEGSERTRLLNKIATLIDNANDAARKMTTALNPEILDNLGLRSTIVWHCQQYQAIYPTIKIALSVNLDETRLAGPLKTAVYRILQAVLDNIVEHYGTTRIKVHVFATAEKLNLAIKDNGVSLSFNNDEVDRPPHFGIGSTSIKKIIRHSGGKLAVGKNSESQDNYYYFSWPVGSASNVKEP